MKKGSIQSIFDQMLLSSPGEKLLLKFSDEKSAEAARVSLYKEKASFSTKTSGTDSIAIRRRYQPQKNLFILELSKISTDFEIWKVSSTGELSEVVLPPSTAEELPGKETPVKEEDPTPETPEEILLQFLKENRSSTFIDMIFLETFPGINWRDLAINLGYSTEEIENNES